MTPAGSVDSGVQLVTTELSNEEQANQERRPAGSRRASSRAQPERSALSAHRDAGDRLDLALPGAAMAYARRTGSAPHASMRRGRDVPFRNRRSNARRS